MKIIKYKGWGPNTVRACSDIFSAAKQGADIIVHSGEINYHDTKHIETISHACVDSGIEVVFRGVEDPGIVYPHITFVEED